jgi:Na+/proline symporter
MLDCDWSSDVCSSDLIHQMVENAYKVTLVVAFVPLAAGLYWRRANTAGAYLAIGLGLATWLPMEIYLTEGEAPMPPQFAGFLMACAGMALGAFLGRQPRAA